MHTADAHFSRYFKKHYSVVEYLMMDSYFLFSNILIVAGDSVVSDQTYLEKKIVWLDLVILVASSMIRVKHARQHVRATPVRWCILVTLGRDRSAYKKQADAMVSHYCHNTQRSMMSTKSVFLCTIYLHFTR